ncbi:hypothetical protein [Paenibacillus hamazuiensis]|uniref:hypothetical protein n=1 Tax=Paenibacillus hamazuiensis TaxID=2936508 RepID=UPI00200C41DD|nr:hypothetical protein [Paenibacillus hamazuiensis]
MKKAYVKPQVLAHEVITFETLLSCNPPNIPATKLDTQQQVCLRPDGTFYYR